MSAPLSVGVDARKLLDDRRGIGRYVRALLRSWMTRWPDRVALTLLVPDLLPSLVASRLASELGARLPVARTGARSFDVTWYPWNGMTWVARGIKIATVHDCWPFASPATDESILRNEQRPFLTTAANADTIIADSVFGKAEIIRHLAYDPARIEVIPLGISAAERPRQVDEHDPYVLFVGQAEKRKDLGTLMNAMAALPEALRTRLRLIVAGKDQPGTFGPPPPGTRVEFAGEVSDRRLEQLYAGARLFVFPSRYEGFGLPILEAMSAGVPVVASDAASVPEVAGDAALYFPAGDTLALATAIQLVLEDATLADRLRAAGRARAAALTWDRCADATLRVFERIQSAKSPTR